MKCDCGNYVSGGNCKLCGKTLEEKDTMIKDKIKSSGMRKEKGIKQLDKELWDIFSEYIRRRDAIKFSGADFAKCITCSHVAHWKEFDCGHGISRRHLSTKFEEKNNHAQCKGCNGLKSGKQFEYMLAVDRKYGKGTSELLLLKSKQSVKWGRFEYEILIKEYKQKIKDLNTR